jgi:hypothetical protein
MITGGDLKEVTWKNSDVGTGRYFSQAGQDHNIDPGGYETADDKTNIDSGANFMNIKVTKPWSYDATIAWDKNVGSRQELQTYQALSNSYQPTTFTFRCIDGTVWSGSGSVVGEIKGNAKAATIAFKVMGSGILTQIA